VDSHSSDATREIAAAHGARVIERDWPGYRAQKQFAVDSATHDWVLCIDADEVVSAALAAEIQALRRGRIDDAACWTMPRCTEYFGRMIRHGGWYPDRVRRLFDRRRARWGGREIHEKVIVDGPVGKLAGEIEHYAYRNLHDQLRRLTRYAGLMARALHAEGRRARWWHLVLSPAWRGFRDVVLKGGWREGWRGLAIAWIEANYVRQKFLALWLLDRGLPIDEGDSR
jgi:glycosyltransferase involved in cell wall biosynthesis